MATPVQSTDYYPFGKSFEKATNTNRNRYLYNGKELQDQVIGGTAFGWYDYGARFYDPELGRWHSVDPSAENYYDLSQYVYCDNNAIRNADPDGKDKLAKVIGFAAAVIDNATGVDLRGHYTPTDAADYNAGQNAGDVYCIIAGAGEADSGTGIASGSVAVTVGTGGLSSEVTVPTFALGTAMAAHGTLMAAKATSSLVSQKGRVDENDKRNVSSGNKNGQHTNQKAKETAQNKYEQKKADYEKLKSKANKTSEDKKNL